MNEGRGSSARTLASLIAVAMIGVAGCSGEENTAAAVATESEQSAAESGADEAAEALPPAEPAFALPTPREAVAKDLRPFSTRMPTITFNKLTLPLVRAQLGGQGGDIPDTVTERTIPGPEGSPDVTVFIADPRPDDSEKPLFLHMHGGGYVVYSARDFAPFLPTIAEACDCVVVSVDYRLAPETQFPGPRDDNFAALKWVVDNAVE
ncbi:MAG: alpha/beta hydrolase [Pseudomonadota bacterium]